MRKYDAAAWSCGGGQRRRDADGPAHLTRLDAERKEVLRIADVAKQRAPAATVSGGGPERLAHQ